MELNPTLRFENDRVVYEFTEFEISAKPKSDQRWEVSISLDGSVMALDVGDPKSEGMRKRVVQSLNGVGDDMRTAVTASLLGVASRLADDYKQLDAQTKGERTVQAEREAVIEAERERATELAKLEE